MHLYTPVELEQLQPDLDELPYFNEIIEWVKTFLAKPHPELGRSGAVCPFVPRALKLNTIRLAVIRTKNLKPDQIEEIVKHYREVFLELEPKQADLVFYKAIMLVFPDVSEAEAFELIDSVQQKLKPLFVESGLMLGEFHPRNQAPGLHNPDFRPLRSPVPMLAIRFMAESDLPFLDRITDDPEIRVRYLEAYLQQLTAVIKDRTKLNQAQTALALAQAQLKQGSLQSIHPPRRCPFARLAEFISLQFSRLRSFRWLFNG